jgi:hypothetical protein
MHPRKRDPRFPVWSSSGKGIADRKQQEVSHMTEGWEFAVRATIIGVGATAVMDLWALFMKRVFGVSSLDYAWVGRWIGHFLRGRVVHPNIGQSDPVAGEAALGWSAHYAIGVIFAALLMAICGVDWARHPTPVPALAFGLFTVVAPFFLMQPAFGAGIAGSKVPNPNVARLRSLMTHLSFGVGLYLAALLSALALTV